MRFQQLLYHLYERRLEAEIQKSKLPQHIGLILDGNRRYARSIGLVDILDGHRLGANKLEAVLTWCEELNIRMVTIWILSTENLQRPPEEVAGLTRLIGNRLRDAARDPKTHTKRMRIRAMWPMWRGSICGSHCHHFLRPAALSTGASRNPMATLSTPWPASPVVWISARRPMSLLSGRA